jgi:hypothetical protein
MCHGFEYVEPVVDSGEWVVKGTVTRSRPEDWHPGPGSWPHWSADPDDRYTLTLVPVAADTTFWSVGDVDIVKARIVAGRDTIDVRWAEIVDESEAIKGKTDANGQPMRVRLEFGKRTFQSELFFLAVPVPDTLLIDFELELLDSATHQIQKLLKVRTTAIADRHRRWDIVDMANS